MEEGGFVIVRAREGGKGKEFCVGMRGGSSNKRVVGGGWWWCLS